jgi:hypothetical protein
VAGRRWIFVCAPVLALAPVGCKSVAASLLLLFPGLGERRPAEFDLVGKRVAVVVTSSNDIAMRDPGLLLTIEEKLSDHLAERADEIDLVALDAVRDYRLAHQRDWGPGFLGRVGRHFRADVVLEIRLDRWRMHQGTHGRHVFQGSGDGLCQVHQSRSGSVVWQESFTLRYPTNTVRLVEDIDEKGFRRDMIDRLVQMLGPQFYEHKPDSIF